ncbi:uncharacterized protein LOC126840122 [Adelges cooleyi]|nr:uncharacterized protein LOC126840122 [Adelges cooleyi]
MGQDEYMSDLKLREVLAKIKERADFDGRFPEIVGQCISNTLQKTANNYRFTFSDVKNYALAYVASGNPDVMEIVHNAVIAHEKPDGMDYEAFRKVIEDVIRTLEVQKPVPSYDEFKADVLSRIFSVNGIENLIIETLFPL